MSPKEACELIQIVVAEQGHKYPDCHFRVRLIGDGVVMTAADRFHRSTIFVWTLKEIEEMTFLGAHGFFDAVSMGMRVALDAADMIAVEVEPYEIQSSVE